MTKHTLNGLRPVAELAADRPHGDRLRYMAGCRCKECRAANTAYETQRALARKAGDWNGVVSAARARSHIAVLSAAPTSRVISDLREEGYRLDRIHTMAADLAKRDGLPVPDLQIHGQHISAAGADLLARLHLELTEVPA